MHTPTMSSSSSSSSSSRRVPQQTAAGRRMLTRSNHTVTRKPANTITNTTNKIKLKDKY